MNDTEKDLRKIREESIASLKGNLAELSLEIRDIQNFSENQKSPQ